METPKDAAVLQHLPISQIKPSAHQARKDFDEESIRSLADSMREEGLIQAITVRIVTAFGRTGVSASQLENGVTPSPTHAEMPIQYELVSGERRLRAAQLLGWTEIEAKVIETVSEAESAAKGLIENLQREDLNPIEEAEGIQTMLDLKDDHWTQEQIGKVIGKSQSEISRSLRFLDLSEEIKQNMRRLIITVGHAEQLLLLPAGDVRDQMAKKIVDGLSVKDTRRQVSNLLKHAKAPGKKMGRPSLDPMGFVWPGLMTNTTIKGSGYWDVAFRKGKWVFNVGSEILCTQQDFAEFFKQMADAILATPLPGSPVAPVPTPNSEMLSGTEQK